MSSVSSPRPGVVVIHVRVSDNVLEDVDWPVRELTLDRVTKKVLDHKDLQEGVYGLDLAPRKGWTLEKVQRWTAVDPTGQHPEVYQEIQDENGTYTQFFDFQDFWDMLERAEERCSVDNSEGIHGNYEPYYMDEEY